MTDLLKGNQNIFTSLTCSVIYLIIFCFVDYVFCGGIEGLKRNLKKPKQTNPPQNQKPPTKTQETKQLE